MTIREFCKQYISFDTQSLAEDFLKENLEVKEYLPFVVKDAIVTTIVEKTMFEHVPVLRDDGTVERKKTDIVKVNSTGQYMLFCRMVFMYYTNLTVESETFLDEYDALKQSGLLNRFMMDTEEHMSLIPASELAELRSILSMKQNDILTNYHSPQAYIQNQLASLDKSIGDSISPILGKFALALEKIDEKDIKRIINKIDAIVKRIK